ncbi:MAG: hypothetical protein ONB46_16770 [candidate division KSB1 bacterium]|nr:hypothetical protein [candidate division KSB1 bacterium]MDZ7367355.1 hypothetical protein [candidate division KSB1 bacterium]MDZ7405236.1 hypothetical protein [candidate division KSB1 bacterium]
MKSKSIAAIFLLMSLPLTSLLAQSSNFSRAALSQNQKASTSPLALSNYPSFYFVDSLNTPAAKQQRSVGKALLFSAVIPGSGQLYNKSFLKGLAFVGIEIGAWAINAIYTQRGNEQEREFERYADAHWSEEEYWDFIFAMCQRDPQSAAYNCRRDDLKSLRRWERDHFSHFLPEEKNQTYYENIGKYDQFNFGWDDTNTELGRDSAHRELYTRMRKKANDQFRIATYGASAVLVNHVLSMLEAAYSANRFNRHHVKASLEMQRYGDELMPALSMRMSW